jgi:glycine/D-amino acid oxidase-like deaminating enzyme
LSAKPEPKDVIIVGGGFAGLTLALRLLERKQRVRVLCDESDLLGASKAAHGISTIKGILESDDATFGLKLEGHRGFEAWLASMEFLADVKRPQDVWQTGATEKFRDLRHFQKEFGRIYRRDFIGAKRVVLRELCTDGLASTLYPGDWWVDPAYVLSVLRKALENLGGHITDDLVVSAVCNHERFRVTGKKNVYCCDVLVLASGVGTVHLASHFGVTIPKLLGVAGHSFTSPQSHHNASEMQSIVVKGTLGFAGTKTHTHWGSSSEPSVEITARSFTNFDSAKGARQIAFQLWEELLPQIPEPPISATTPRWGVRVRTRDRRPVCGRLVIPVHPNAQLWINTAYYKSGLILGWLLANDLSEEMCRSWS